MQEKGGACEPLGLRQVALATQFHCAAVRFPGGFYIGDEVSYIAKKLKANAFSFRVGLLIITVSSS